jgi:YHS domain-containing protein
MPASAEYDANLAYTGLELVVRSVPMKDPVCGMDVDPASAAATSDFADATYYFCSAGCKSAFDAEPAKYLDPDYVPDGMPSAAPRRRWWEFWKLD